MGKKRTEETETSARKYTAAEKMKAAVEPPPSPPYTAVDDEENKRKKKKKRKEKEEEEETAAIDVKIETLGEHPDKISPLVGYFPSGFDPLRATHRSSDPPSQPRVKLFRHEKRTNRLELVVSPSGAPVDFVGTNYSGEAAAGQVCTYALGVLDKETRTLKIVPIASNKIFRLEPRVEGSDASENELVLKEDITAEEKRRNLNRMYSTKKAINRDEKNKSLYQKEDPRAKKVLDKKLEGLEINNDTLENVGTYDILNIPPHDMSATTPQTAYPLDKIIFKGEWNYLLDILEFSQGRVDEYPSFVRNRVHKLEETEDDEEKKRLACVLSYITHLIKFKEKCSVGGSTVKGRIPDILFHKFSAMFTDTASMKLSGVKQDLLISYILVLTLYADDFRTDPSDIARDMKMNMFMLRPHFCHLGCKFVSGRRQVTVATLPVPLKFPHLKTKRMKPQR